MTIKCITFDLDDTLWAVGPVISRAEQLFYEWLNEHYPRITEHHDHLSLSAHRRDFIEQYPLQRFDLTTMRKRWIEHVFAQFDYREHSVDDAFRVFWEYRNAVQLFDEVRPAMDRLCEQYSLGVITNGNACVEYIGISHWFDFVVSSESAGHAKPAPEIFQQALQQAGVAAEQVVHIGDDVHNDVHGAAAVGMRTIWYNPQALPWQGDNPPDAQIRSMAEVHAALDAIV